MKFNYHLALLVFSSAAAYAAPKPDAVHVTVEASPIYKTNYIYVETVVVSVDGSNDDSIVTVVETGKYETVLVTQTDGLTDITTLVVETPAPATSDQYILTSSPSVSTISTSFSSYFVSSIVGVSEPTASQSSVKQMSETASPSFSASVETSSTSVVGSILATDSSDDLSTSSGFIFSTSLASPSTTATTLSTGGEILAEKTSPTSSSENVGSSLSSSVRVTFSESATDTSTMTPTSSSTSASGSSTSTSTSSSTSISSKDSFTFSSSALTSPTSASTFSTSTSTSSTSTSTSSTSTSTSSTSTSTSSTSTSTSSTSTSTSSATSSTTTSASSTTTSTSSTSIAATTSNGAVSNIVPTAIVYSPYSDSGGCKDASTVKSDLELIASKNIGEIRVYATDCDSIETVQPAAANLGIKINQGFWIDDTGVDSIDDQVSAVISYGEANGWDIFSKIIVGNEAILNGWVTVSELLAKGQSVISQLRSAGYTGPVLTAEPPVTFTDNPTLCTSGIFDAIGINSHSYYATNVDAAQAGEFVAGQLQATKELCSIPVYVTETGYPSAGDTNGENIPSAENQKIALAALLSSLNGECTILTTYNDYWKQPGPYNIEQYFGVIQLLA